MRDKDNNVEGHQINECNSRIVITPIPDGSYTVSGMVDGTVTRLRFHSGPTKDGTRGLTNEVLFAVLIDRFEEFQKTAFACDENAQAIALLQQALAVVKSRTDKRFARGVEGTQTV